MFVFLLENSPPWQMPVATTTFLFLSSYRNTIFNQSACVFSLDHFLNINWSLSLLRVNSRHRVETITETSSDKIMALRWVELNTFTCMHCLILTKDRSQNVKSWYISIKDKVREKRVWKDIPTAPHIIIHVAPCKVIRDSLGIWIPCCGFRIPGTRFWIPISPIFFSNLDSGFHKRKFLWFQNPDLPYVGQYMHHCDTKENRVWITWPCNSQDLIIYILTRF